MDSRDVSDDLILTAELETRLARSIDLPLAALRASLESLNHSLPGEDPLGGVIDEVLRIGTNVRELVEFTCPPQPQPTRCQAAEITGSALRGLSDELRERILVAEIDSRCELSTDVSLVASALRRVIENALEAATDQVLLTVRQDDEFTTFSVIDHSAKSFDPHRAITPFHSTKSNHMGLGLALTRRDLGLVGGSLRIERTKREDTTVSLSVPNQSPPSAPR